MEKNSLEETVNQLAKIKKDKKKQKQKMPKEVSQKIIKKVFRNLLAAILIIVYFVMLNIAYTEMIQERLILDIKVFAILFLVSGIFMFEKAYKKDSGKEALKGIELLVISFHSLSIMHVITLYKYDFRLYLLTSSYIFSIYFVIKCIVIYFKERKKYIKSLSDISEIIKKEEPQVKEAIKRNIEENIDEEKTKSVTKKKKTTTTKKSKTKTAKTNKETKTKSTAKKSTKKTNNKKKKEENVND